MLGSFENLTKLYFEQVERGKYIYGTFYILRAIVPWWRKPFHRQYKACKRWIREFNQLKQQILSS